MGAALDAVVNVWALLDAGNYGELGRWFNPDAQFRSRGEPIGGLAEVTGYWQATARSFPDLRREIVDYLETPDAIALEVRATGTNTGPLTGAGGDVPATGRACAFESIALVRLRDGKISQWHDVHDQLGMLRQLGMLG
jgi:predicted ester cyclase